MGLPVKGAKAPLASHLAQVQKTLGRKPKELEEKAVCPAPFRYLWDYYLEIKMDGFLTHTEIKDWAELLHINITHWEVRILKTLDRIYWKQLNDRYRKT